MRATGTGLAMQTAMPPMTSWDDADDDTSDHVTLPVDADTVLVDMLSSTQAPAKPKIVVPVSTYQPPQAVCPAAELSVFTLL